MIFNTHLGKKNTIDKVVLYIVAIKPEKCKTTVYTVRGTTCKLRQISVGRLLYQARVHLLPLRPNGNQSFLQQNSKLFVTNNSVPYSDSEQKSAITKLFDDGRTLIVMKRFFFYLKTNNMRHC